LVAGTVDASNVDKRELDYWIYYKLDDGDWTQVSGIHDWRLVVDAGELKAGVPTLLIRMEDGLTDLETSIYLIVVDERGNEDNESPGFGLIILSLSIFIRMLVFLNKRKTA